MAKVSGETGGRFSIFQEGPITWMAPTEVLEGGQVKPGSPFPRPMPEKLLKIVATRGKIVA